MNEMYERIVGTISEMALDRDHDDPNVQWVEGYQQACRDIALMICRAENKRLKPETHIGFDPPK